MHELYQDTVELRQDGVCCLLDSTKIDIDRSMQTHLPKGLVVEGIIAGTECEQQTRQE